LRSRVYLLDYWGASIYVLFVPGLSLIFRFTFR
jgi:hypothetical protein